MTLSTIPKPPDRKDWLKARHTRFTASDAACLYSAHPFKTLADVAVDKLSPDPEDGPTNDAMERGQRLEPFLLEWFGDKNGCTVVTPDVLYVNGRLMATLDGVVVGNDTEWLEAKTTSQVWSSPPQHVLWQVRAQGAATGRSRCHVIWIDAEMTFKHEVVDVDPADAADVLARAEKFMDFIELGMTPEGVEYGADHIKRLFPEVEPEKQATLDDDDFLAVVRWAQIRDERLAAEKAEKAARDEVARLFGDAAVLDYGGEIVATFRNSKPSSSFDMTAFRAAHPDLVAEFTVERPGARRLLPTKGAHA